MSRIFDLLSLAKTQTVLQMLRFRITDTSSTTGAGGRSVDYTYDAWARLKTSLTTGSTQFAQWGLKWAYDRYGNRTNQTVTHGSGPSSSLGISTSTNRITDSGYTYDSSGNLTNDGLNALVYDGENHVTSSTQSGATANYTYDGGGLRIKKVSGSTTTIYIFSGTKVIAEYENGAAPNSPTREYLYSGSQLLASLEGSTTRYHLSDHLSTRVLADTSGTAVAESGHFPFGENWYSSGSPGSLAKLKFTSYERDSESGNDFAMARYHINRLGRFNSPDPIAGSVADPQSMNRFAYTRNDPINLVDPLGAFISVYPSDPGGSGSLGGIGGIWWIWWIINWYIDHGCQTDDFFRGWICPPPGMPARDVDGQRNLGQIKKELMKLLENPNCAKLFGENPIRFVEALEALKNVNDPNWKPNPDPVKGARELDKLNGLNGIGPNPGTAFTQFVSVVPHPQEPLVRQWDRAPFYTLVGKIFGNLSGDQQNTVLIHELLHVAFPSRPASVTETPQYNDMIANRCKTGKVSSGAGVH